MNIINKIVNSKKLMLIISLLGLYLFTSGISLVVFAYLRTDPNFDFNGDVGDARSKIDESMPKTEACPVNGTMFTKAERAIWEERRPIAAVIENHADSRPQSGLANADVVYEVVAEGGITRFLSVFYCGASAKDVTVGPIRSARVYLISWAMEYGQKPLFVHFGGANNICQQCPGGVKTSGTIAKNVMALEKLIKMGWRHKDGNALDGGANVNYPVIWRDPERLGFTSAWEHSAYGSTDKLFDLGIDRGYGFKEAGVDWNKDFTQWSFKDDSPASAPAATQISFEFWRNKPDYDVSWKYDQQNNRYLRSNGGKPHLDFNTKQQLSAKNVVVMSVEEQGPVDKELHLYYETVDKGNALVFQDGRVIQGSWEKKSEAGRTLFYDSEGKKIEFVKGNIWIEAVPAGNKVSY